MKVGIEYLDCFFSYSEEIDNFLVQKSDLHQVIQISQDDSPSETSLYLIELLGKLFYIFVYMGLENSRAEIRRSALHKLYKSAYCKKIQLF